MLVSRARLQHAVLLRRTGIVPTTEGVIAGLDPAIHLLRMTLVKMDGCAGQARA
jgi:hypothetical protein